MTAIEDDLTHALRDHADYATDPISIIGTLTPYWVATCRCGERVNGLNHDVAHRAHLAAVLAPIVAKHVAVGQEQALLDAADEQERLSKAPTALKSRAVQFKRLIFANWLRARAATYTTTKETS